MAYKLTLPLLNRYARYFNALSKAGIEFEIQVNQNYDYQSGDYSTVLSPQIKNVKSLEALAKVWEAGLAAVKATQVVDFPGFKEIYSKPTAAPVTAEHYKKSEPSVKYYAEGVFSKLQQLGVYLITATPAERVVGDHTYRICCTPGDYYNGEIVFCASETNPYYNYIDRGHIIVTTTSIDKPESFMFVTNQMTLDMNYIIAAFSVYPEAVMEIVQVGAFLPSKDVRLQLMKVERAIPPRFQAEYQARKAAILEDFQKNTSNVMVGKLTRGETPFVDLNNIRITRNRAVYTAGNVSIEADNLAEVIFASLNINEEWDIFTLINIYTDWVENQFKVLALNDNATGFKEKKTFNFKINDVPLKVECFVENTRRAINDHLINVEELSKTMRRAECYLQEEGQDNVKDYNNFVRDVARVSLKVRDILSNGLPVKTVYLKSDERSHGKDASSKHPKLRFTRKDKKGFFLVVKHVDKKDPKIVTTEERRIGKFVEFINKVQRCNTKHYLYGHNYGNNNNEYQQTHEGGWERRDGKLNPCATEILNILATYAEGITEDDKTALIGHVNKEMSEAEKRSQELLADACKATGAKKVTRQIKGHDIPGYIIPGQMRTYFVEEDALRVYTVDGDKPITGGDYVCVVNGRGDQGVGKDSLVARIYALHNDKMVTKQINTLNRGN